jgi:hypothetical protein
MPKRLTLEVVVLLVGLAGQIGVVVLVDRPTDRLAFSLACLVLIVWSAVRLGPMIGAVEKQKEFVRKRRFLKLRANVVQMLAEIRRLNWLVVDEKRGTRPGDQVEVEIRQVEDRLNELLDRVRATAGVESKPGDAEVGEGGPLPA